MGFLDKAKENLEKVAKQGQEKLDEVQSKKKADGLLRDLGAWTYAAATGRDNGNGPAEVKRITAELQAHEAEHGPLGGDDPDDGGAGSSASTPAVPTPVATPTPPPMSGQGTPPGSIPPAPTFSPPPPAPPPAPSPSAAEPTAGSPVEPPLLGGGPTLDEF